MADGKVKKKSSVVDEATTPQVPPVEQPQSDVHAKSLLDIARQFTQMSTLNAEGKQFVENLKGIISNVSGFQITQISTDALEGVVIHTTDKENAIMLILADSCRYAKELSPTSLIPTFTGLWENISGKNNAFIQAPVIYPDEYNRVEKIANNAINIIRVHTNEITLDGKALACSGLKISTNRIKALDFIEALSPHAVPARADITLTVSINTKDEIIRPTTGFNQNDYQAETIICALTAYTDFVNVGLIDGVQKFRPIITITDIVSVIPSPQILALMLPVAADAFISKGEWKSPFKRFGSGYPNIGNLVKTTKGKLAKIDKVEELDHFIANTLIDPVLAIDVTDGRFRLPGIDAIAVNADNGNAFITTMMDGFFTSDVQKPVTVFRNTYNKIATAGSIDIIGIYRDQQMKDSRYLDYLEFAKTLDNTDLYEKLLAVPTHPLDRITVQKELVPEIVPMYINRKCYLIADFIKHIADFLAIIPNLNFTLDYDNLYSAGLPNLDASIFTNFQMNIGQTGGVAPMKGLPAYQPPQL